MRIEQEIKLDYDDVLIRPKRSTLSSRQEVDLLRTISFPHGASDWTGIPIIAANMDGVGTRAMADALSKHTMLTALHKFLDTESYAHVQTEYSFITIGIRDEDIDKLKEISKNNPPRLICVDVANGYTQRFVDIIRKIRELYPSSVIMAGNVVTGEMTEELILSGADIVKVGIGPGSVCTTRKMTGIGYPQLSAVIECADAAHGLKGLVCADGGLKVPGDVAKAFGAGADFVMSGSMFTGHKESGMEIIEENGEKYLEYFGSSSDHAMNLHMGGKATYRASEGKKVRVPYKGQVDTTVEEILGGLRSACTYVGARRLKELSKRTTFVRVSRQLNDLFK
jgi:GMP reductase